jgi:hypothetical protein
MHQPYLHSFIFSIYPSFSTGTGPLMGHILPSILHFLSVYWLFKQALLLAFHTCMYYTLIRLTLILTLSLLSLLFDKFQYNLLDLLHTQTQCISMYSLFLVSFSNTYLFLVIYRILKYFYSYSFLCICIQLPFYIVILLPCLLK